MSSDRRIGGEGRGPEWCNVVVEDWPKRSTSKGSPTSVQGKQRKRNDWNYYMEAHDNHNEYKNRTVDSKDDQSKEKTTLCKENRLMRLGGDRNDIEAVSELTAGRLVQEYKK